MLWRRGICRLIVFALLWAAQFSAVPLHAQSSSKSAAAHLPGEHIFASTCAGCHGLDGDGSERAPGIARNPRVQHLSDAQIAGIVSNGVPGTGMPPFRSLGAAQIRSVVDYLQALQGISATRALPGDPKYGKEIFFGKGECSSCHAISDQGGFFGPDLSGASSVPAKTILAAIVNPPRVDQSGYKAAGITTHEGNRVEGVIRNEDNFSVQLLAQDGSFHFFQKSDLQSLEYLDRSYMPSNYRERLTAGELNDLVSYMMSVRSPEAVRIPEK